MPKKRRKRQSLVNSHRQSRWITIDLDRDNIDATTTSITPANDLSYASHTWYVKAVDKAGNSTNSNTFSLTITCARPPSRRHQPPTEEKPIEEMTVEELKAKIIEIQKKIVVLLQQLIRLIQERIAQLQAQLR